MSQREQKKWFKSAFSEEPLTRKRSLAKNTSHDSIDLTMDVDEIPLQPKQLNNNEPLLHPTAQQIDTNFKSSNWIENFAPQSKNDLAIHAKKIGELEDWFRMATVNKRKCSAPILLINGPSGCGKTATLKVISEEFGYTISEWITPVDVEHIRHGSGSNNDNVTWSESQCDRFAQFLFHSSRYTSVFDCSNTKRLVLVEDFPNIFIRDQTLFEDILERYMSFGLSPLVFVVTDTKSKALNIAYNLFSDAVRQKFGISNISFNAVSDTLLKKGLNRICSLMSQPGFTKYYTQPDKSTIDSIAQSSQGDIRNAVINLHFASQKNACPLDRLDMSAVKPIGKTAKRSRKTTKSKLKSLGCDESITVLHGLGRIFNPKYGESSNAQPFQTFLHSPENISSTFITQPRNMLTMTHTNYLCHFSSIDHVVAAIDILTEADVFLNEWRDDLSSEIAINIATRGLMVSNEKPVSGWMPIRSSKKPDKGYDPNAEIKSMGIHANTSANIFATDYRHYTRIIQAK